MDVTVLARQNPWWRDPGRLRQDTSLETLEAQAVKWRPRLYYRFRLSEDRVYTLRGPRQVGKITLLKLLVSDLVERSGTNPRSIFYYTCDMVRDARELADLVESYLQWQKPFELPRRYIFLDEVSSVRDWAVAIRGLSNRGSLRGCTVILTGSHAIDVLRQVGRLPGRRGEARGSDTADLLDKILMPMKFAEYAETQDRRVRKVLESQMLLDPSARWSTFDSLFGTGPSGTWSEVMLLQDELSPLLRDYLITGGFPRPLNDLRRNGRISGETYDLYIRALTGDLVRWGHDERLARDLLAAVVEKIGTRVSWRTLASETEFGSHHTVRRYIETLERTFTLQTVHQYDEHRKRPSPKKERKVYIADPFMFHATRAWALGLDDPFGESTEFVGNPEKTGLLLESVVADHLARLAFGQRPTSVFDAYEHVLFWRSKKGWEVDFVLRTGKKPRAIQVTATRPRQDTLRALRAFGGGITVTETGEAGSVSLAAFLLLA